MVDCLYRGLLWSQTQTKLEYQWPLPAGWVILVILMLAGVLWLTLRETGQTARNRVVLLTLRLSAILVLVGMLPGWSSHQQQTGKPDLIILVDSSLSMQFEDEFALNGIHAQVQQWLVDHFGEDYQSRRREEENVITLPRTWLTHVFLNGDRNEEVLELGDSVAGVLAGVQQDYKVHFYEVDESVHRRGPSPERSVADTVIQSNGTASAIGTGIVDVLQRHRGKSVAGIVLLSDGRSNVGVSLQRVGELARRLSVPIIIPQIAGSASPDHFQLVNPSGPTRVHVDQPVLFEIDVQREGEWDASVELPFRVVSASGEHQLNAVFDAGQRKTTLSIRYSAKQAGEQSLRVEYAGRDDESGVPKSQQGHLESYEFVFQATDQPVSVLLVEQFPRFEFRALQDLLDRAVNESGRARFDVTTVLGTVDPQLVQEDDKLYSSIVEDRDWLFGFDVIVIGDVPPGLLTLQVQNMLVEYVQQRGGGLVFIAGDRFLPLQFEDHPLEELLPTGVENFESLPLSDQAASLGLSRSGERASLTMLAEGADENRRAWSELAGPYWSVQSSSLHSGVQVLIQGETQSAGKFPLLTQQFLGAGRVAFQSFDATWRWNQQGDFQDAHAKYWSQLLHYLAGNSLGDSQAGVELSVSAEQIAFGESVQLKVRFLNPVNAPADDAVVVELSEATGKSKIVRLARDGIRQEWFSATLSDLHVGEYSVRLVSPVGVVSSPKSISITVGGESKEQTELRSDQDALRSLAVTSGGKYYELNQWFEMRDQLPHGRRIVIQELDSRLLWNANWLIVLFAGLISTEWWLRRRWYN